ncbi:MAG: isopentenyl-diphosphate Delta-isomerase [Candidatus Nitrosotenuis sp.]|uniref:isopentenyl-diphosphate Delta-isomerase n=1 Tax=Candidatus Nitrosotenuis uzonensis TaxID=1407055 RepID=A0A812EZX1_9ARCH|nr:isopentenyl-diphosphate Delta-isomerase [Candidatus Nitrosotenuis uzonensis]CAE6493811.1 Isopentenyl-diphosphate delta-isomerase, type 1 [Candidatus Nitrosotenuis uzonensis]
MSEYLILVDKDDNPIGMEEKVRCHLPDGKLHRAFTVLLFDKKDRLLLTRRSPSKMLWPGDWDGTVASHPRKSETYVSSAERRLPEEIGASCRLDYLFKFEYHVPYKNIGSENEICGTLVGIVDDSFSVKLVEDEISEVKWASPDELFSDIERNPQSYCPWMLVALHLLEKSDNTMLQKYHKTLAKWIDQKNRLEESLKHHFPTGNWRLLN